MHRVVTRNFGPKSDRTKNFPKTPFADKYSLNYRLLTNFIHHSFPFRTGLSKFSAMAGRIDFILGLAGHYACNIGSCQGDV